MRLPKIDRLDQNAMLKYRLVWPLWRRDRLAILPQISKTRICFTKGAKKRCLRGVEVRNCARNSRFGREKRTGKQFAIKDDGCPVSKLGSFCQTTSEHRRGTVHFSKQFNFLRKKQRHHLFVLVRCVYIASLMAVFFNFGQRVLFRPCWGPILSSYTEGKDF